MARTHPPPDGHRTGAGCLHRQHQRRTPRPGAAVAAALVLLVAGCAGAPAVSEVLDRTGDGGTYPLDPDERCDTPTTAGCQRNPGEVGDAFTDDAWTVRYRGAEVDRSDTGEVANPAQLEVYVYLDVTNEGDRPRSLTGYDPSERFEAGLAAGSRSIDPCDPGDQIPSDGAVPPGETLTLQLCFGNRGLPHMYEDELSLRLSPPCGGCGIELAVEDQEPDDDVVTDVFDAVELAATSAGLEPGEVGYAQLVERTGGAPEGPR